MEENNIKEAVAQADTKANTNAESAEHSHRHGHHSHHRHKKKSKLKSFVKKYDKVLKASAIVLSLAILVLLALAVDYKMGDKGDGSDVDSASSDYRNGYAYVGIPIINEPIVLVEDKAAEYINAEPDTEIHDVLEGYVGEGLDIGRAVELSFDISGLPSGKAISAATLELSENEDLSHSAFYDIDKAYTARIYNLKAGTGYYYKAVFTLTDGSSVSGGGSFKTAKYPRIMSIDGIRNTRDIGGWSTSYGKDIKQGLLYRGTELDGAVEPTYKLTEAGVSTVINQLGIKTDIDLRNEKDSVPGTYVLGNVTHKYYDCGAYGTVILNNTRPIKEIFSALAKPDAYPIYLHCTYGTDRTGTVCYILGALLGMSEEDLIKDYELSGIMVKSLKRSNIMSVYYNLQKFEGETLAQKTESYLLDIGVAQSEIDSIKNIFLGE